MTPAMWAQGQTCPYPILRVGRPDLFCAAVSGLGSRWSGPWRIVVLARRGSRPQTRHRRALPALGVGCAELEAKPDTADTHVAGHIPEVNAPGGGGHMAGELGRAEGVGGGADVE